VTRRHVERPDLRELLAQVYAHGGEESALHAQLADCIRALAALDRDTIAEPDGCLVWCGPVDASDAYARWRLAVWVVQADIGRRVDMAPYDGDAAHAARVAEGCVRELAHRAAGLWERLAVVLPSERRRTVLDLPVRRWHSRLRRRPACGLVLRPRRRAA